MLKKWGNAAFIVLVSVLLLMLLLTLVRQQPTGVVAIRSYSMEPLITRGDLVFIKPVKASTNFKEGQIVIFRAVEEGIRDWTLHRIVGGNAEEGFITKGDANKEADQFLERFPAVKADWIVGVVPTIGGKPVKIPLLGYLPLLMEENMSNPKLLPVGLGIIATVLLAQEYFYPRKMRKKRTMAKGQLYLLAGLAFSMLMLTVMLTGSLFLNFTYGVDDSRGVLLGSDVGVLQIGDRHTLTFAELENSGRFPAFYYVAVTDPQLELQQKANCLFGGEFAKVEATVYAQKTGIHQSTVCVGMFLPFLPLPVIAVLAEINIWLAFIAVALVPALPLLLLPWFEPRFRRDLKHFWQRLQKIVQLPFL